MKLTKICAGVCLVALILSMGVNAFAGGHSKGYKRTWTSTNVNAVTCTVEDCGTCVYGTQGACPNLGQGGGCGGTGACYR